MHFLEVRRGAVSRMLVHAVPLPALRSGAALVAAIGILAPLTAAAQLSPAGDEFEISTSAAPEAHAADVAMRADGRFVVVWESESASPVNVSDIDGRLFLANGEADGDAFAVPESSVGPQQAPSVAVADNGRFLVAWAGKGEGDDAGVFARIFEAGGAPAAASFPLHPATADDDEHGPSVARDGDGFAVAWMHSDGIGGLRVGAAGNARGSFEHAATSPHRVAVAGLAGRRLALAWSSSHDAQLTIDSEGEIGRVDGVVLGADAGVLRSFEANTDHEIGYDGYRVDGAEGLAVAADAAGRVATAYDSVVPVYVYNADDHWEGFPLGAKIERFDSAGDSLGSFFVADHAAEGRIADIAVAPGGNSVAVIESYTPQEAPAIWIRTLDCHGEPMDSGALRVNAASAYASGHPSVAVNEQGDVVVVWEQRREDTQKSGIVARRFHLQGGCSLCGDADSNGRVTALDALSALRRSIGSGNCPLERCDADGSGKVGAADALRILKSAVSDGTRPLRCRREPVATRVADATLADPRLFGMSMVGGDGEAVLLRSRTQDGGEEIAGDAIDGDLQFVSLDTLAGPVVNRRLGNPSGCFGTNGLAAAWSDGPGDDLPIGITLDLANVALSLPGIPPIQANTNLIGSQGSASIACLSGGRYALSWASFCDAVDHKDAFDVLFRPDECDNEPPDGVYATVFDADGTPISPQQVVATGNGFYSNPSIAVIDGDRFVVSSGSTIQVRSSSGDLLDQTEVELDLFPPSTVACVGTLCAQATGGRVLLFDADHLASLRTLDLRPTVQLGADRRIAAGNVSLACEAGGVCVETWILEDSTSYGDYIDTDFPGVYARPFDLASGKAGEAIRLQGSDNWTNEAPLATMGPGSFIVAVNGLAGTTLHRVDVR